MRENNGKSGSSLLGSMLWRTLICFLFLFLVWKMVNRRLMCAVRTVSGVHGGGVRRHVWMCASLLLMHTLFFGICSVIATLIKAKRPLPQRDGALHLLARRKWRS